MALLNGIYCPSFSNETDKCISIIAVKNTTGSLSLIGSTIVLFLIVFFMRTKTPTNKIILNLFLATWFNSINYVINHPYIGDGVCDFFGSLITYTNWTLVFGIATITYNLWYNVNYIMKNNSEIFPPPPSKHTKVFFYVTWTVPLLFTLLPFFGYINVATYGPAGPWCWLLQKEWRFSMWFVPGYLALAIIFVFFLYSEYKFNNLIKTWKGQHDEQKFKTNMEYYKLHFKYLRIYTIMFIILKFFAFIHRIIIASTNSTFFVMTVLMSLTVPSVGFIFTIIYLLSSRRSTFNRSEWNDQIKIWRDLDRCCPVTEHNYGTGDNIPVDNVAVDNVAFEMEQEEHNSVDDIPVKVNE